MTSEERSEATRINKRPETGELDTMLHIGLVLYIVSNNVCEIVHSQSREQPVQNRDPRRRSIRMYNKDVLMKIDVAYFATILLAYLILYAFS